MPTFKVSTKANKDAPEVVTTLTVNLGKPEVMQALAMQALVVKWQGHVRKHGIPATATINMDDFAPGTRHAAGPMSKEEAKSIWIAEYRAADPEKQKAMLAELATPKA